MRPFDVSVIEHKGRTFEVSRYSDDIQSPPWENSDGHGTVRYIDNRESLGRGEVILCDLDRGRFVYNFGAALLTASRDKWGLPPPEVGSLAQRLGKKPTKAQIRAEAVRKDMQYLRGFCSGDWIYIGVCVRIIGSDGAPQGEPFENALWGIESCGEYWEEVAHEIADEILSDRGRAWRAALREARARKYWAARDVVTVGAG